MAFGLAGDIVQVDETAAVLAYLQQLLTGLVSVGQRLLPLGQSQASQLIWQLKPTLSIFPTRLSHLPGRATTSTCT